MQSMHMNIYNKWLWKTDTFSVQLQTPTHGLLKKKKKAVKAAQQIYMKYNLLKYFCNQNSIGIHLEPQEAKLLRSLQNVFIHYYVCFPEPMQIYAFNGCSMRQYQRFMWLSRLYQKVQTVSGSADGLHGLLMAGVSQVHAAHLQKRKNNYGVMPVLRNNISCNFS